MSILLAVDPASISAAVALFRNGNLVATSRLLANKKDKWSVRLLHQHQLLKKFLADNLKSNEVVDTLVVEQVSGFANAALSYSVGALASIDVIQSNLNLLGVSTWKAMCRRYGNKEKDPKGIPALKALRPDIEVSSEDEADAVLIGLAFLEKGQ